MKIETEVRLVNANYLVNKGIRNCPIEEGGIPLGDFHQHQKILALYPTVDAIPVSDIEAWLYEIAMNNTDNTLSDACEEIIRRLDGLKQFSKERRTI